MTSHIREKQKLTGRLNVGGISPVITLQEKTIMPTTTLQEVVADEGYDGLSKVNVEAVQSIELSVEPEENPTSYTPQANMYYGKVNVGGILLETVNVTPSSSAQTIIPSEGYNGIGEVNVSAVTQAQIPAIPTFSFSTSTVTQSGVDLRWLEDVDFSQVEDFRGMFNIQTLQHFPLIDISSSSLEMTINMFMLDLDNSNVLITDESLNNILQMCINAPFTSTLGNLGIMEWQTMYSRIMALSNYQAFIDAGWAMY